MMEQKKEDNKHRIKKIASAFGMNVKEFSECIGYSRQALYQGACGIHSFNKNRLAISQRWMVMGMDDKCRTCTIKCRQADHIHETALGRMYALNELLSYVKKVDSGELVEVVRCKDCKHHEHYDALLYCGHVCGLAGSVAPDDFCSYGERKDNG